MRKELADLPFYQNRTVTFSGIKSNKFRSPVLVLSVRIELQREHRKWDGNKDDIGRLWCYSESLGLLNKKLNCSRPLKTHL